ncbi:MAG: hypothetical protein E7655_02685 [Ruminococcaceae bacterium]|nr:hypothetical protein [Oscillospiraceae bacterium]
MMDQIWYVFVNTVYVGVWGIAGIMMISAIASWLPFDAENKLIDFCDAVSEAIVSPIASFLDRFEAVRQMPFDISFFLTFLVLMLTVNLLEFLK